MKVLIACEFSGRVRDAFIRRGHDAWSCDLIPADGPHLQTDVRNVLSDGWDLMIAHPPCTRLCNSGVRWLHERDLWDEMHAACDLFNLLLNAPIPRIAVENPTMHGYARGRIRPPDQAYHPWQFGAGETKRTCLWLKGLPKLVPTTPDAKERKASCHLASPGPNRWKIRSLTPLGVAEAMAEQWSRYAKG